LIPGDQGGIKRKCSGNVCRVATPQAMLRCNLCGFPGQREIKRDQPNSWKILNLSSGSACVSFLVFKQFQ